MKLLGDKAFLCALVTAGVLLPLQAQASVPVPVPEPVTGLAGLGAAELIRRRKKK